MDSIIREVSAAPFTGYIYVGHNTDDICQQTWQRVSSKLDDFDNNRSFGPWLIAIGVHLALDHLRRTRPESGRHAVAGQAVVEQLAENNASIEAAIEKASILKRLLEEVDKLPEREDNMV